MNEGEQLVFFHTHKEDSFQKTQIILTRSLKWNEIYNNNLKKKKNQIRKINFIMKDNNNQTDRWESEVGK